MVPDSKKGIAVLAAWVTVLGVFLMLAPDWFYGPSWYYFADHHELLILPAGGFGMGVACVLVGSLQLLALWREAWRWLPLLFFLSGFVLMTSGMLLTAEGLEGREGLMEGPFMCTLAVHKYWISVSLRSRLRDRKQDQ